MGLDGQLNIISEPVGTLDVALGHAARLLERDAALAAEQASEILKAVPGHPHARLILGAAHRIGGQTRLALEILEPLAREQPRSAPAPLELAIARGEAGLAVTERLFPPIAFDSTPSTGAWCPQLSADSAH